MKKFIFPFFAMLCAFIFAQEAKAQTITSAQLLSQSKVSAFYLKLSEVEAESSSVLLSEEQALTTTQDVASKVEIAYTNELTDEGLYCVVIDGKGNKVASCYICSCAKLARAYLSIQE